MLFDCIFCAFSPQKTAKIALEVWNLFQNIKKRFQKRTSPWPETFGNFRGRENGDKSKKSQNGTPWGVMDKPVPGRWPPNALWINQTNREPHPKYSSWDKFVYYAPGGAVLWFFAFVTIFTPPKASKCLWSRTRTFLKSFLTFWNKFQTSRAIFAVFCGEKCAENAVKEHVS